jgi:hypothetical protein
MKREWETCNYDTKRARWGGFHVTMTPRGEIYMNANTLKAMDAGERFVLLYDRPTHTIGVQPANSLTPKSQGSTPKGKRGGRWVRAFRLLQQCGIGVEKTVRFLQPVIEDGVLILDLRNTTTAAIRRRPL